MEYIGYLINHVFFNYFDYGKNGKALGIAQTWFLWLKSITHWLKIEHSIIWMSIWKTWKVWKVAKLCIQLQVSKKFKKSLNRCEYENALPIFEYVMSEKY